VYISSINSEEFQMHTTVIVQDSGDTKVMIDNGFHPNVIGIRRANQHYLSETPSDWTLISNAFHSNSEEYEFEISLAVKNRKFLPVLFCDHKTINDFFDSYPDMIETILGGKVVKHKQVEVTVAYVIAARLSYAIRQIEDEKAAAVATDNALTHMVESYQPEVVIDFIRGLGYEDRPYLAGDRSHRAYSKYSMMFDGIFN
jgi:hypothetical protein